ncbi:alpha/beta hydrolase family protein [Gracilibacillus sp. S3-1-1]|uniref:Alpha/beta hydrolase family protein n=1 Tax=Gracilibacillus pellucidus TaxID=3095368 RepID=A0ACC6M0V2_9BACI|nr:alpha/beta hydrolase family protein [Gracilibacillus sp. S3-1-1]MDX8044572.1 alpha/beta hydrolase family protein [Gracilibacillus sp. S3-1-1]
MNQLDQLFEDLYEETLTEAQQTNENVDKKEVLQHLLGDFTYLEQKRIEMKAEQLETKEFASYKRERISLSVTDKIYIRVYVLTPKKAQKQYPSMLAIHGHGYGVNEAVGLTANGEEEKGKPSIHNQFAVELAKRGFKVFAPEVIGFGTRRLTRDIEADKLNSCEAMATSLLLEGKTLTGLRVWEARAMLDYMVSCSDVDSNKIGMMGFSGGAVITTYTAVLDERVQATILTGFPNTFKGSIMARRHCIDNYIPGILQYGELPDWIRLIAPRSLFIESGENDPLFPSLYAKKAIAAIATQYDTKSDAFAYDIFPGGHEICGRQSYDWLRKQLID